MIGFIKKKINNIIVANDKGRKMLNLNTYNVDT